jgi:hypothetical protein
VLQASKKLHQRHQWLYPQLHSREHFAQEWVHVQLSVNKLGDSIRIYRVHDEFVHGKTKIDGSRKQTMPIPY